MPDSCRGNFRARVARVDCRQELESLWPFAHVKWLHWQLLHCSAPSTSQMNYYKMIDCRRARPGLNSCSSGCCHGDSYSAQSSSTGR
jgi:hypothetical protein